MERVRASNKLLPNLKTQGQIFSVPPESFPCTKIVLFMYVIGLLPDPRGAGLEQAFQFSYVCTYVRMYVRTYVRTSVSEIKSWSLHIH